MKKRSPILIPALLCILGIALGTYQSAAKRGSAPALENAEHTQDQSSRIDFISYAVQGLLYYPQRGVWIAADWTGDFLQGVFTASSLKRKEASLEAQVAASAHYAERIKNLESEISRLRAFAGLPQIPERKQIAADIVNYFPAEHRIKLNAGRNRGVKPGSAVISAEGLVGQVVEVSPAGCFVNLLTHPDFSVGARIERAVSQEVGIANGQSSEVLLLNIFHEAADAQPGDAIVTSGLSEVYPEGIPVGFVTKVWSNKNLGVRQANVQPSVNIARLRHVLVLAK